MITKNLAEDIDIDEIKSKLKDLIDNAVQEDWVSAFQGHGFKRIIL